MYFVLSGNEKIREWEPFAVLLLQNVYQADWHDMIYAKKSAITHHLGHPCKRFIIRD